jgi:hypothetical protein
MRISMTRETAESITRALLAATNEIDDSLVLAQLALSESESVEYRRRVAKVLGALYLDVIKWVVQDYPELDPGRQR